jgi:hypothetical protein
MNQTFYLTASQTLSLNEMVNKKNDSDERASNDILQYLTKGNQDLEKILLS